LPALAADCRADAYDAMQELRIDGLADGATIARAPNSANPASVRLRALGAGGEVSWLVNGRLAAITQGSAVFEQTFAETGTQTITALTAAGAWAQIEIDVLR
ncbi:MAG: penicillin-binding protein 1C, partial [Xanthomonadales bacterium]|nr:penicillin-binding protein 1C [Xanthomonadales bacterium]